MGYLDDISTDAIVLLPVDVLDMCHCSRSEILLCEPIYWKKECSNPFIKGLSFIDVSRFRSHSSQSAEHVNVDLSTLVSVSNDDWAGIKLSAVHSIASEGPVMHSLGSICGVSALKIRRSCWWLPSARWNADIWGELLVCKVETRCYIQKIEAPKFIYSYSSLHLWLS